MTFERTPARLERGRYLVEAVVDCFGCHSDNDWTSHDAHPLPGKKGGGALFPIENIPFKLYAPNVSPDPETGAGKWTDEDFYRALTQGIGHDGRTLFPFMPYPHFREMADEDLASIIVYVRSIEPVRNALPRTEIPDPIKAILKPLPPKQPAPLPDWSTPVKRGGYLVNAAGCSDCHTPATPQGEPIAGLDFAGGENLKGPWGEVASSNITPDASGLSYYNEGLFVQMIRTGYQGARKINQIMPFGAYRNMADADLKAIFAYLCTFKPVAHRTDNTEAFAPCKKCGNRHGLGAMN